MTNQCTFNELRDKEVINICTGQRLGYVNDALIDLTCGRIAAISVPYCRNRIFEFPKIKDILIPWERIEKIGEDIIVVKVENIPQPRCDEPKKPFF